MVNEKLVEYINSNLAKGHSLEEIRKFIVNYGWSEKDFDEAVLLASGSSGKPKKDKPEEGGEEDLSGKKKGHKRVIFAIFVLIIVILIFLYVTTDMLDYFSGLYPESVLPLNFSFLSG